jgi:hypothetical protein
LTEGCCLKFWTWLIRMSVPQGRWPIQSKPVVKENNTDNKNCFVCFLLGNSPASEIYMPKFRKTLFHLQRQVGVHLPAFEDGTEYTYLPLKMEQSTRTCLWRWNRVHRPAFEDGTEYTYLLLKMEQITPTCFWRWNIVHLPAFEDGTEYTYLPLKMEQTQCSETFAYKIQTPGNYPEEHRQHSEQGESWKQRKQKLLFAMMIYFNTAYVYIEE